MRHLSSWTHGIDDDVARRGVGERSQGCPQGQSTPPNVVGYPLDEARAVLAEAGWTDVETTETRPPRRGLLEPYRVLRQRLTGGRVALVVSGERSEAFAPGSAARRGPASGRGEDGAAVEDAHT